MRFYEALQTLRLTAAVIYDRGRASGQSEVALQESIKPISDRLAVLTAETVHSSLGEAVQAHHFLKSDLAKLESDVRVLMEKIQNVRIHMGAIEEAVKANLKNLGVGERTDGEYSVVLARDKVTFR